MQPTWCRGWLRTGREFAVCFVLQTEWTDMHNSNETIRRQSLSVWHQQMLIIAPCTGAEQSCGRSHCLIVFFCRQWRPQIDSQCFAGRARARLTMGYRTWAVLPCRLAPKALIVTARERTHTHIRFNSMHRSSVVRAPLWAHVYVCGDGVCVCVCVCRCIRPVRIAIGERRFSHYAPRIWNSGTRFRWLSDPLTVMTSSRPG